MIDRRPIHQADTATKAEECERCQAPATTTWRMCDVEGDVLARVALCDTCHAIIAAEVFVDGEEEAAL